MFNKYKLMDFFLVTPFIVIQPTYSAAKQLASVSEQMTAAVSTAASDQPEFPFDISPTDTAEGVQAKRGQGSPDSGIKTSTHRARPAQQP